MIKKWIFVAGAGIGYVLGTRAGRQRYEEMKAKAKDVLSRPDVKEATDAVQAEANRLYQEGRTLMREKVRDLRDRTGSHESGLGQRTPTIYATTEEPAPLTPLN